MAPPRQPDPMLRRFPGVLGYLVHVDSFLAVAGLSVLFAALEWVGSLPGDWSRLALVSARLLWGAYFFLVARKAALGKDRLPVPSDLRDTWDALIAPLARIGLAAGWYWLAVLLVAHFTVGVPHLADRLQGHPTALLVRLGVAGHAVLAVGLAYLPVAVLSALVERRVLPAANPLLGVRLAWRVPRAYAITFVLLTGLELGGTLLWVGGGRLVAEIPIPLAAPVIRHFIVLWVPLAQARLIGTFVHVNRPFLVGEPPRPDRP